MTLGAILDFGENGRLYRNFKEFKGLLTLNISLLVITILICLAFTYFLWQFNRRSKQNKYLNKQLIGLTFGLVSTATLTWVLNFIFYYSAAAIFMTPLTAQNVIIACSVIGYFFAFSTMLIMWFKLPYYGIIIDEANLWFLGESLPFTKITKVVEDENGQALYINYAASIRLFKYYRLKINSGAAQFLCQNLPENLKVERDNQAEYFRELSKTLPNQEQQA